MKKQHVNKERAPIYEMMQEMKDKAYSSFHVPGHKKGQAYTESGGAGFLQDVLQADLTEITGTDDLHHPEGVIREAQALAADCFGAEESFFLVGGSTSGNIALILTVCSKPGDLLIVQRNVHKSVIHGLMLAGAKAVFIQPEPDPVSGLAVAPSAETVTAALAAYPQAKGVLVTMPNYYGMGSDLAPLAKACHQHGVPLLVDEAHGAHYGQHPRLPGSALASGADGVVQSTHKMLAALTMGAMLHVQGPRIDRGLLRQRLAMVQSSSPSYPIMGSLDLARRLLHVQGADAFTAGLAAVDALVRGLAELPRFKLLRPQGQQPQDAAGAASAGSTAQGAIRPSAAAHTTQDPFKVVIYDGTGVLSGYELQERLEAYGCVPEMSDDRYVVLVYSLGSTEEDTRHLLDALRHITVEKADAQNSADALPAAESCYSVQAEAEEDLSLTGASSLPKTQGSPAEFSTWNILAQATASEPIPFGLQPIPPEDTERVPLQDCADRTAAEMIIPYPPGIPLLYPGERITEDTAARLRVLSNAGAKCQGAADPNLRTIIVYKKNRKQGSHL